MDEELIARTVREVLQEIGRMEASVENSVSMDAKTAVNGYIHGYIHGMSLRLAEALAAKVEEKAEELGMRVVTAVADEAGHPKLVRSMDGAYIGIPVSYTHLDVYKRQVRASGLSSSCFRWNPAGIPFLRGVLTSICILIIRRIWQRGK